MLSVEKMHRRATKLVDEIKGWTYEDRLKYLGLTKLQLRRARGDMIEVCILMTGNEVIEYEQFFEATEHISDDTGGKYLPSVCSLFRKYLLTLLILKRVF